jgi:hypothetical protein
MKLALTLLAIPLIIVMVSKDPKAAADGVASRLVLGAKLLDATANLLNEILRALAG